MENLRLSGIPALGDIAWGSHFSQFYKNKQELLEVLVPYFKAGLENNEYCVWVTSEPLLAEEGRAALANAMPDYPTYVKKGQIEIVPYTEWCLQGGAFDAQRVLASWVEREQSAVLKGYEGVRLSGNAFWLESHQWKAFIQYESDVNAIISFHHLIALCSYGLDKCSALDVLDVLRTHEFALDKQDGEWQRFESANSRSTRHALEDSENVRDKLYRSMKEGVCFHKMVYDYAGHAVDYVITSVNPAYETITGLSCDAAVGRKASEVYGGGMPPYLDIYAEVAGTGKPTLFETYFTLTPRRSFQVWYNA